MSPPAFPDCRSRRLCDMLSHGRSAATIETYLAYHLSHPSSPGEIQSELGIWLSSSFLIQVKNLDAPSAPQAEISSENRASASYPPECKHKAFGEGGLFQRTHTTFLNYTGRASWKTFRQSSVRTMLKVSL